MLPKLFRPDLRKAAGILVVLSLFGTSVTQAAASAITLAPNATTVAPNATTVAPARESKVILILHTPAVNAVNLQALPPAASRVQRAREVISSLQSAANATQPAVLARLEQLRASGKVKRVQPFWIVNAIAVTVQSDQVAQLAALPGVESVTPDHPLRLMDATAARIQTSSLAPNLEQIQAPEVWAKGFTGQGTVVANLDTGVNLDTYSLKAKYRGGSNSWHDVFGVHASPYDADGHGTGTMGIMVADNIGVAPGAKWMAVKIFDDSGAASDSDAILGLQWVLAPNGDPASAPNVVNNSWAEDSAADPTQPCPDSPAMRAALQALVAANILPIFAAGNFGPGSHSAPVPSSYPEVIAVGATDSQNIITTFSSRGPTNCRTIGSVFPDLSAPGASIPFYAPGTSTLVYEQGTSFSAPHVAGALAVLLSAFPHLSAGQQRQVLLHSASDLGTPGPDNVYGYGALNLLNMYYSMLETHITYLPAIASTH